MYGRSVPDRVMFSDIQAARQFSGLASLPPFSPIIPKQPVPTPSHNALPFLL
jgi:hypothetical protein